MNCEFSYCIYNRDAKCVLSGIQINSLGMCEACIVVSVPEKILTKMKDKQLSELERTYIKGNI